MLGNRENGYRKMKGHQSLGRRAMEQPMANPRQTSSTPIQCHHRKKGKRVGKGKGWEREKGGKGKRVGKGKGWEREKGGWGKKK